MALAESFAVEVDRSRTTGLFYQGIDARAAIVLAHGAGAPQTHPFMITVARALSTRGIHVVTFNFLYAETKRRVPDRSDVLEATWRSVFKAVRSRPDLANAPIYVGGKSMGGRIATQVVANGQIGGVSGLVLLGYPLHPPGKPDRLRAAHLPSIEAPMLFVQGSRDAFGTPDELGPIVARLARARLHVVEGADHSLALPKSRGQTLEQSIALVADEIQRFIGTR